MKFQFATASNIVFRSGAARDIPGKVGKFGAKPCLVTGSNAGRIQWLIDELSEPLIIQIADEPDTDIITEAAAQARNHGCDVVVAIGGGSVMDAGKIIAALITNTSDIFDYLEVVGKGNPLTEKPVPLITAPTTSGTGSEVTTNGVVLSKKHGVKVSLRSTEMIADVAIVDPELTLSMPPAVTAATGMDALTQLIEAFVSNKANPMTDSLCREGIMRAATSLPIAYQDGNDLDAREDMALASLLSGIALANAKLGAVHGFAAPLGGEFKAPHGVVCAALLPYVMHMNIQALEERDHHAHALHRYNEIAVMLTGDVKATPETGAQWILDLCEELQIPTLSDLGVTPDDFNNLARNSANASSMKGNPIKLTHDELMAILEAAL